MSPCTKKTHSEKRLELHRLLLSKLIGKYGAHSDDSGVGTELHPANEFIQAEVDLFMHNHDSVRAGDLAKLERTIRHATQSAGDHYNHNSRKVVQSRGGATSGERLQNIDSSSHDYSYTPKNRDDASVQGGTPRVSDPTRSRSSPDMARKIGPRATTSGGRVTSCGRDQDQFARRQSASSLPAAEKQSKRERGSCSVPPSKYSNWLTLQTYQQLVVEDKDDEDQRKKREASQRCKQGQVGQIRQNLERAEENKREAARAKEEQRRLIAEHESHQALLRDAAKKKVLEERCARAHQMLENERRRGKERHEEQVDNEKILATCKKELREEQEAQFKKRKEVAQSLRAMYRENIAKLAERERQKALEAEEDRRLMEEYRKKLDREEEQRATEHRQRMERYEMIGKQWAERGAGKKQHDIQIAEERRLLEETTRKEKADEEREKRDKEALWRDSLECLVDNRRLMEEKNARKRGDELLTQVEDEESAKFARQFRSEGEKYVAETANRKREMLIQGKIYARKLTEQIREAAAARVSVEMTDREREVNGQILRALQRDPNLQARISRRLLQQNAVRKKDTLHGASGGERP